MTTPEPRVRVTKNPWMELDCTPWSAHCPYCAGPDRFEWRYTWRAAMDDAIEHATEEPCDGLRLAALLARLERLRDLTRKASEAPAGTPYERGLNNAFADDADDLDALIAEARGC